MAVRNIQCVQCTTFAINTLLRVSSPRVYRVTRCLCTCIRATSDPIDAKQQDKQQSQTRSRPALKLMHEFSFFLERKKKKKRKKKTPLPQLVAFHTPLRLPSSWHRDGRLTKLDVRREKISPRRDPFPLPSTTSIVVGFDNLQGIRCEQIEKLYFDGA